MMSRCDVMAGMFGGLFSESSKGEVSLSSTSLWYGPTLLRLHKFDDTTLKWPGEHNITTFTPVGIYFE